jgi:sister-chromatid-cohesion protein PDS5
METVFALLLSLLAHHPDFTQSPEDLADFSKYILFYLRPVASEENLSLIYYVAQRVKQYRDAVKPDSGENLYYLSDLAQTVIRRYEDVMGWSMQAWPGKLRLPGTLFAPLSDHKTAQEIAMKQYLPEELVEHLDSLVKAKEKTKKVMHSSSTAECQTNSPFFFSSQRKSIDPSSPIQPSKKRARPSASAISKTPSKSRKSSAKLKTPKLKKLSDAVPSIQPSRRSARTGARTTNYADRDDEEDDEEMELLNRDNDEDRDVEDRSSEDDNDEEGEEQEQNVQEEADEPEESKEEDNGEDEEIEDEKATEARTNGRKKPKPKSQPKRGSRSKAKHQTRTRATRALAKSQNVAKGESDEELSDPPDSD